MALQADQFSEIAQRSIAAKQNRGGLFNGRAPSDQGFGTGRSRSDFGQGTGKNIDSDATSDWAKSMFLGGEW